MSDLTLPYSTIKEQSAHSGFRAVNYCYSKILNKGSLSLEQLIASLKVRIQQVRQQCPYFQLEQQATKYLSPILSLPQIPADKTVLIPEIAFAQGSAWSAEQQMMAVQQLRLWQIGIHDSNYDLFKRIRKLYPQRYLIARDLIVDEYQILQARAAGANAVTLSCGLLEPRRLSLYLNKIRFWEMDAIVEVCSLSDLECLAQHKLAGICLGSSLIPERPAWAEADILTAAPFLKAPLLIYAAQTDLDPELLQVLPRLGVQAWAPGAALWLQSDPESLIKAFS